MAEEIFKSHEGQTVTIRVKLFLQKVTYPFYFAGLMLYFFLINDDKI